ncbi:flagellar hook-associated protein FlgK [Yersinia rochesterensis]|uniref:Flagellar hook-associated protein 1 n=1 Tax=Yersinia rochesterensis TaxID=1604335 RepID=A0A386HHX9_9GAMM|nr:flagellar hook-associated protein FlgK [Yersinia rochesterensis]AJI87006.1 flagellar hook-associated protein FlgK [Yersinia frederiksenii Y225]CNH68535.1 flagellar hook-associated protein [Yersinia kristensenii]AIN16947.1 flagellar hook-associated protein FlgK [Yersinia rochesterensis]AJJ35936.1 flagellar hook-associated protein FlgK [Yersinia rochesterensis]AYD45216.1 flagellar hook-associated protein FlgK [Yersinia rochesterensis]
MNFTKIAQSGLQAAQASLSAAAMNLSNVNTPGYSRQRAEQSAVNASGNSAYSAGNGVNVDAFKRLSEQYLVSEEWKASSNNKFFSAPQNALSKLEHSLGDENTGLAAGMRAFFNSLSSASNNPSSLAYREQVVNEAKSLALNFNYFHQSAQEQKQIIATQRTAIISQVNNLTKSIAEYNQKIVKLSSDGTNTNVLQDQRDQLVKKLSEMVEVRVIAETDGRYNISMKDGTPLINGQTVATLALNTSSAQPQIDIHFAGNSAEINMSCGASLGSINNYEQGLLKETENIVQGMAQLLTTEVNTQLAAGYDLGGTAGAALFSFDASNPTGMLSVTDIKPSELGFSDNASNVGNATNLHALLALKDKAVTISGIGPTSLSDAGTALVGKVAFASSNNQQLITQTENVLSSVRLNRDSLSSVDSDEEGNNILEYSKAYRANMKVISIGEQLFSDFLALMR